MIRGHAVSQQGHDACLLDGLKGLDLHGHACKERELLDIGTLRRPKIEFGLAHRDGIPLGIAGFNVTIGLKKQ